MIGAHIIKLESAIGKSRVGISFLLVWLLANTNVAAQTFWQQTNLSSGVIVRSLVINSSGHIFAGTADVGVFRSLNNGDNWTQVNSGLINLNIQPLAINSSGHIFAGTLGDGVFRSTDNGASWTQVKTGLANPVILSLAINASGHVFAGTSGGGIFRSMDNGNTWTSVNASLTNTKVVSLAISASGHIFAGTNGGGVFRSTDNGDTWIPVNTGLTNSSILSFAINASGHVFAGTSGGGIFRSIDNGSTWTPVNTGLTNLVILSFAINANGHIFAGTPGDGVFRSTDNGDNWTLINTGLTNSVVEVLAINATGRIFAGTSGGGVFRSVDSAFPFITHVPSSLAQSNQTFLVDANITDDTGIASATLNFRRGGDLSFTTITMVRVGDNYRGAVPAESVTSHGVEYFIIATDLVGNITRSSSSGIFSVQVRTSGVTKGSSQPSGDQSAYRLISVPLNLDDNSPTAVLEDDLGPYNKKKWRFFELRPDQSYSEFPNTSAMVSGNAFWLLVREADKVIDTGPGISNRTNREYAMPLYSLWNFIANPFNFTIPVKNVSLTSGRSFELRTFTGSWNDPVSTKVTAMQPFEGYATFNTSTTIDTLFIDPDLTPAPGSLGKEFSATITEKMLWSIRVLAQCQEAVDEDNIAAIVDGASNAWDEMDQPEPPPIGEYVSVYFPHPEWDKLAKIYCTDFRSGSSEGYVWLFEVKTNIRDKVNLSFEGLDEVPAELEVWLMDEALKITQNLRERNHYTLAGSEHPKQLKLIVGKRDFVDEKLAESQAIPTTYELSQNFPNPFNPVTTIRFGLPNAERVTLKVYNLLGKEVVTLVNDEKREAGYHISIWDGRNKHGNLVASGVYAYRIRAGSFSMTKKLVMVK